MPRHTGPVLVDTNVILECWRVGAWRALAGGYGVETVEDCVTETQTGFQRRRRSAALMGRSCSARWPACAQLPRPNSPPQLSETTLVFLDPGERSLWAHAMTREDTWLLCGPDKASLRLGIRLGFRDRLVALEQLLEDVGHRPREALRQNYTRRWHEFAIAELALLETGGRR